MRERHRRIPRTSVERSPSGRSALLGETCAPALVGRVAELRAIVTDHACRRRAAGIPLEHVLVEVGGLVRDAERLEGCPDELGVLLGQVRLWSLAAYCDDPELPNVRRSH